MHISAKLGQENGEMNDMTPPSRHRIRNLSPVGLRLSTLPLGHGGSPQYYGGTPRVVVSTAAFHAIVGGSFLGLCGLKEAKMFLPHPLVKLSIAGSLSDREVACSASNLQG